MHEASSWIGLILLAYGGLRIYQVSAAIHHRVGRLEAMISRLYEREFEIAFEAHSPMPDEDLLRAIGRETYRTRQSERLERIEQILRELHERES